MNEKFKPEKLILPMGVLDPHPDLTQLYDYKVIGDLADSIRELGMIEPLKAKSIDGRYVVLSGWRRYLAAQLLGFEKIRVDVLIDLPEEDERSYILASNKKRERTLAEKYREIQLQLSVTERRQGHRSDLTGEGAVNTREEIAKALNLKSNEVRDLITIGEFDARQLETIGLTANGPSLSGLAAQIRKMDHKPMPKSPPVTQLDLSIHSCPLCNTYDTPRIVVVDRKLFYQNDLKPNQNQ